MHFTSEEGCTGTSRTDRLHCTVRTRPVVSISTASSFFLRFKILVMIRKRSPRTLVPALAVVEGGVGAGGGTTQGIYITSRMARGWYKSLLVACPARVRWAAFPCVALRAAWRVRPLCGTYSTADAPVVHFKNLFFRVELLLHQGIVDSNLTVLVFNHSDLLSVLLGQYVVE